MRTCRFALRVGLACLALGPVAACTPEPDAPVLAPETYVDVMVALRRAHEAHPDPAAFEAERIRILGEAGVTDSLLVRWVRARGGEDTEFIATLWDSINARLTAAAADSAR